MIISQMIERPFASEIFHYLVEQMELTEETLILFTNSGQCLCSYPINYLVPAELFDSKAVGDKQKTDYFILASSDSNHLDDIQILQNTFYNMLTIFCRSEQDKVHILKGLDVLPVSISIYDKNTRLLEHANDDFRDYLHIKDRNKAYGRSIEEINKDTGMKIHSTRKPQDHLKLNDVVKYGRPVVDWEVEVFICGTKPDARVLASNDMYPVFDDNNNIIGATEIARSRREKIKQVQNTLGLTAEYTFDDIIGNSTVMLNAKKLAMTFSNNSLQYSLYMGKAEWGKELFAQSIR